MGTGGRPGDAIHKRLQAAGLSPESCDKYILTLRAFLNARMTKVQFEADMATILPAEKINVHNAIILDLLHRATTRRSEGLPDLPVLHRERSEKRNPNRREREREREREKEREREREKEKEREKIRDKEKDREREKDRNKEKEGIRDREKERHEREKELVNERVKEPVKEREKGREIGMEKEPEKAWEKTKERGHEKHREKGSDKGKEMEPDKEREKKKESDLEKVREKQQNQSIPPINPVVPPLPSPTGAQPISSIKRPMEPSSSPAKSKANTVATPVMPDEIGTKQQTPRILPPKKHERDETEDKSRKQKARPSQADKSLLPLKRRKVGDVPTPMADMPSMKVLPVTPPPLETYDGLPFKPVRPGSTLDVELLGRIRERVRPVVEQSGLSNVKEDAIALLALATELQVKRVLHAAVLSRRRRSGGTQTYGNLMCAPVRPFDVHDATTNNWDLLAIDATVGVERLSMLLS